MVRSHLHVTRILRYAKYVESLADGEAAEGCKDCAANRLMLEKAWQVGCLAGYSVPTTSEYNVS